jgi:hypothetical protein
LEPARVLGLGLVPARGPDLLFHSWYFFLSCGDLWAAVKPVEILLGQVQVLLDP